MGICAGAMNLLLDEAKRLPFSGKVITLGRLHTYSTPEEVLRAAKLRGVTLADVEITLHSNPLLAEKGYISDESLFRLLGFETVERVDYSDYENVEEILDLNSPETPDHLCSKYDAVVDFGTMEHVFHIPNCLAHLERIVKQAGRIIHLPPSGNSVNHGFYSISPTLLVDYYSQRGHEVSKVYLCQLPRKGFERKQWHVYDYLIGNRNWLPLGRLDHSIYFTFAVITAADNPDWEVVPQQSAYLQTWEESGTSEEGVESPLTKAGKLLALTRGIPVLEPVARFSIKKWRGMRHSISEFRSGRVPFPYVGRF